MLIPLTLFTVGYHISASSYTLKSVGTNCSVIQAVRTGGNLVHDAFCEQKNNEMNALLVFVTEDERTFTELHINIILTWLLII